MVSSGLASIVCRLLEQEYYTRRLETGCRLARKELERRQGLIDIQTSNHELIPRETCMFLIEALYLE